MFSRRECTDWRFVRAGVLLWLLCGNGVCGQTQDAVLEAANDGVTIAVTADINPGKSAKTVSDLILENTRVQAVLLVGDAQNSGNASVEKYRTIYQGTYDRFWEKLHVVPGNHDWDHQEPMSFASYIEFWKEKAHAPELYYSFDLGGWHFVGLDSMTLLYGRNGEANARQMEWLKRDLAAHAGKPRIAFWHVPAYSSARHGPSDELQKHFCTTLYEHGPALIFVGHTHVYERYDPMDGQGKPAAAERGLHHFTICPGGATPEKEQRKDLPPPLPRVFHGNAQHVGFFTLFRDGRYQFHVKAVDEKLHVSDLDHGEGKLDATTE